LAHAHSRGIVHRDLKPANVLLTDDGQPMLLDFNLADETSRAPEPGRVGGTLPYMAPEQLETFRDGTGRVDGRADVYALGLILYELLAGKPAFPLDLTDRDPVATMLAARRAGVPTLSRKAGVSAGAAAIVAKCLEYDLERRYPSAQALAHDIELYLTHRPAALALNPSRRERLAMWARRHRS
jgi:serine/threonine protein kinase